MTKLLKPFLTVGNAFVYRVLQSRFHWLFSGKFVLLQTKGRKSGRTYLVPVNYRTMPGANGIWVMTYRRRQWWRNVRDGGELSVYLRGRMIMTVPEVITDDLEAIAAGLLGRGWVRRSMFRGKAKDCVLIRLYLAEKSDSEQDENQKELNAIERS